MTGDQATRVVLADDPDELIIGAGAVADILGLHVNTVKRLPAEELGYYRVNSRGDRRYRLGDVRAYLAARRVG